MCISTNIDGDDVIWVGEEIVINLGLEEVHLVISLLRKDLVGYTVEELAGGFLHLTLRQLRQQSLNWILFHQQFQQRHLCLG